MTIHDVTFILLISFTVSVAAQGAKTMKPPRTSEEPRAEDPNSPNAEPRSGTRCSRHQLMVDLSGVWQVRVEELSIWAPLHTLSKTIGSTRWKISVTDGCISLSEHSPASATSTSPDTELGDSSFQEVAITDLVVRDGFVAFKIKKANGVYEHYRLEQFSDGEIVGTYTLQDRPDGDARAAYGYPGRLILVRVE